MDIIKGEEKEQGLVSIFRQIVHENFQNLRNELELRIQEVNRTSNYLNPKKPSSRHIVLKLSKVDNKDRILRAAREKKKVIYKGKPIRLSLDFSAQPLQTRKEWNQIFELLSKRNYQSRIMYPTKLSFKYEGEI
uniref:Uncharacterized protein n=1 Tax=Rousettus aegyptiacus TaxID=9407 RepID=A0A7J8ILA4_ROUAE|nr:hypothetical protein HJG63_010610 [Rousettus aegyptiacus]